MKRIIIAFLFLHRLSFAQFDISVQMNIPQPNRLEMYEVWNADIINNMSMALMPANITLQAILEDTQGDIVYEAETEMFIANTGTTAFSFTKAQQNTVKTLIENSGLSEFNSRHRELPDGIYRLCINLTLFDPAYNPVFTTGDCIIHTVEHPGIIIPTYPINGDTVPPSLVQFTWTNSSASVAALNPKYKLTVVPILDKQSPEEAIGVNIPIWEVTDIDFPFYDYPPIERPLDTVRQYAWQVTAYTEITGTSRNDNNDALFPASLENKSQTLGVSEVAHFICAEPVNKKKKKTKKTVAEYYINLNQLNAGTELYFFEGTVPILLNNRMNNLNIRTVLLDEEKAEVRNSRKTIPIQRGLNKFMINYSELALEKGKHYFLEISLSESEKYSVPLIAK